MTTFDAVPQTSPGDTRALSIFEAAAGSYTEARTALSTLFTELARTPERFGSLRAELSAAEADRASRACSLGELVWELLGAGWSLALPPAETTPSNSAVATPPAEETSSAAPPPERPQVVATPAAVADFAARFQARGHSAPSFNATSAALHRELGLLARVLHELGPVGDPHLDASGSAEIDRLARFVAGATTSAVASLAPERARAVLTYLIARVRAAQDVCRTRGEGSRRLDGAVRRLAELRAGMPDAPFVHGFKRDHAPRGSSWAADADTARSVLEGLAGVASEPTKRDLPRAARPAPAEPEAARVVSDDGRHSPDSSWPHWSVVRGKRAMMVGGVVDAAGADALESTFELASLDWIEPEKPRLVQRAAQRVQSGSVDLVLVNKFVPHRVTEPIVSAARQAAVPYVIVRRGYGVGAVREAIDRAFDGCDPHRAA